MVCEFGVSTCTSCVVKQLGFTHPSCNITACFTPGCDLSSGTITQTCPFNSYFSNYIDGITRFIKAQTVC